MTRKRHEVKGGCSTVHYMRIHRREEGETVCICITNRKSASGRDLFSAIQALNKECGVKRHRKEYNANDHMNQVRSKFNGALGEGARYL